MRPEYEGKFFYEIVKPISGRNAGLIQLAGPFDNIYYAEPSRDSQEKIVRLFPKKDKYKFVQVVGGTIVQAFTEEEILVTDRKL